MRYENPLYMAEEAAATDLISGGRLELGVSRGSPEPALRGSESFGYVPAEGQTDADVARDHTAVFRAAIAGRPMAVAAGARSGEAPATLAIQPQSPGLSDRIWWGAGTRATAEWAAGLGMNLMSSTLLTEDTGVPFDQLQAEQIGLYRAAWLEAGHERTPRVSVSRSVLPVVTDLDRRLFGDGRGQSDQVGILDGALSRFGKQYIGSPDAIAEELSKDAAVRAADTLLLTVPNQLGVDYNAQMLKTIADHIAPAIGWTSANQPA
jgi:alkanesulfonate monooxygenase SsuD/methylene tetrahydromethanopterin reductase-like flavin-dependent oxidoreductase (luciferase family)